MRNAVRLLLLAAGASAQPQAKPPRSLDIVLLVEDSILTCNRVQTARFEALRPGDRMAVMLFSSDASLRQPFTGDLNTLFKAVRKLTGKGHGDTVRMWDGLVSAARLFPAPLTADRKRVVVLLFSKENAGKTDTLETTRRAFAREDVSLSAAVFGKPHSAARSARGWRLERRSAHRLAPRLPQRTLAGVAQLVAETGGIVQEAKWDLAAILDHARQAKSPVPHL